jgi:LacI family transcriptional regulator
MRSGRRRAVKSNSGQGSTLTGTSKKQATIVDVAQTAGVAIGTVSRYLNGLPIRASNRQPIEAAITELGYRRNMVAVSMKRQTTHIVGLMVPNLSEFHAGLLEHLTRRLRATGRAVLCYSHDLDPASIEAGLEFFSAHRVDAVVVDGLASARQLLQRYVAEGLPLVIYDNDIEDLPADRVFTTNRRSSQRLINHLIELGHTRIATISGNFTDSAARERRDGYIDALVERGLPVRDDYIVTGNWNEAGAYAAIRDLMALSEPPTAVFSANYNMTMGALHWLREHNVSVPDDLSVVSFDDVPAWSIHPAGITAIDQSIDRLAETVVSVLLDRLEAGAPAGGRTLLVDANIILRGSARSPRK